jgi:hypothetical protein
MREELIGQGLLSNLTAAVNLVRASWPSAMLAYGEDFCLMVSGGFDQTNEFISPENPDGWPLPGELDLFSIDYYCGYHGCPHALPAGADGLPPINSNFDHDCAAHLQRVYEQKVYPRLGPKTKVVSVAGAWAPFAGANSPPCPEWTAGAD